MAVGDWHELNGYRFRETLHGPMHEAPCGDCGHPVMLVLPSHREGEPARDYPTVAKCSGCGRAEHGAALPVRTNHPRVTVNPRRLRYERLAFFFRALHPDDPRIDCWWCGYPIDEAARTVEHPDRHPACARYRPDAPMETPLT